MEFRRINSTLQSAAVGTPRSARAAPSPTGASTPTAKTMSKASLLPGGAHGTPPCTPPPMSGKRRKHSAVPLERSNSTAGRAFQRTNSTMGRQKGETIRQNNRVNVYVRVRAFAQKERSGEAGQLAVKMKDDTVEVTVPQKGNFMFTFDGCFWSNDRDSPHHRKPATQDDVFEEVGRPLVENVLSGYNAAVMAYGQTGSGKTYTTYGPAGSLGSQDEGLVPRVCNMIFARAANSAQKGVHYTVKASMLEVYLDDVFDLLNHRKQLTVRNDFKNHTFAVVGSKNVTVTSYKDVLELLTKAEPLRTFAETKIHDHSSRAHTLFTLEVHTEYDDTEMKARCARILMADLAGCERIRLAGTEEGVGFEEARNINLSLLALGSCIEAVASRKKRDNANIPEFRNSTLTKLLKDFLGGNSVSVMMVTIAPSAKDSNLSVQTLRFADRAKQITTHAKMNVIDDEDEEKGTEKWEDSLKDEYRRKREALLSEIQLKSSIEKLGNQMKDIDAKLLHPEDLDEDTLEYLQTQQDHISNSIRSAEQQLVAPMQILYGDYLNLEEELRDANTKLAELRTGLDEELDRQRSMYEQQQREQYMAFEDEFSALRLNSSDEIERLKRIIKELEEENDRLRHNLDVSHKNEQDLADQLIDLQRLHNEATMTKQELQEHLLDLAGKLADTEAVLDHTSATLGKTQEELHTTSTKLADTEAAAEEISNRYVAVEESLEEMSAKLAETAAALETTTTKLAASEVAHEEAAVHLSHTSATLHQTTQELHTTQETLMHVTTTLEDTNTKLSESEAAREETAAKLADTEAALEETSAKLSESEAAREETAAKLADTEAALEETSAKLSESEAAREETAAKLADTEAALEETSAKLSESEAAREETSAKLVDTEAALEETSAKLADAEGELGDVSSKLAEMEAAVEELSTKLAETEGALEESNEKLNESEAAREETLARLADTEAALEETAAKLAESEVEVAEVTAKLAEMEAAAEELSSRLAETEAAYDELGGKHSELEALQAETAARCGEAEVAAEEAMTRLAETEAALDESNAKLSETEALYEETAGRLADTEAALEETSQRLSSEIEQLELALSDSRLEVEQHTLLNEKMAAQFEDSMETVLEGLTAVHYEGLTGFSNETVAYMQRLQESLGMSEAEMKENLARFNLLRSVLCKIDQEVKVATDGVQNPSSMGLRNCAPNVERTALKE